MKKLLFLLIFWSQVIYSQDDINLLKLYPLDIGNEWQYELDYWSDFHQVDYYYKSVTGDTLFESNGKKYYIINTSVYQYYERIDSSNFLVYSYYPSEEQEYLKYDLKTLVGDTVKNTIEYGGDYACIAVDSSFILNIPTVTKKFHYMDWWGESYYYDLSMNFGHTSSSWLGMGSSSAQTLIYAKINGDEYGEFVSSINSNELSFNSHILLSNYPNPFNPLTTIEYFIPITGHVEINVYNSIGKKIQTLVNEETTSGIHEIIFDGSNFASGTYYIQLKHSNTTKIKKMILIK